MWAGIVSVLKALPVLLKFWDMFEKYKEDKLIKHYEEKARVRTKITKELSEAKTDEDRKLLIERLAVLNSNK